MDRNSLYYKIYDLFGKHYASEAYKLLSKSQFWSRAEIEKFQAKQLFKIINNAKDNISFYKTRIHMSPRSNWTVEDYRKFLADIQTTTKKDLNSQFDEFMNPLINKKDLILQQTGGSTGYPTKFYHSKYKLDYNRVAVQRHFDWAGYHLRKKCLRLANGNVEANEHNKLKGKIKNKLYNRYFYNAVTLEGDLWINDVIDTIVKYNIKVLWGYPSIIYMIAKKGTNFKDLHLEAVITSSENLFDNQRKVIEEAFSCPVFDEYGSREFMIAGECGEHNGMHINEEIIFLDIVNQNKESCKPLEEGHVIITDLNNMAFPLINYEIGDIASFLPMETCTCGRNLRKLNSISGRSSQSIMINDMTISPVFFHGYFKSFSNIESFQFFVSHNKIKANIILKESQKKDVIQFSQEKMKEVLHHKIDVEFSEVSSFIPGSNGKVQTINIMDSNDQ